MAMNKILAVLCAIPGDAGRWLQGRAAALWRFAAADHPYVFLSGSALSLAAAVLCVLPLVLFFLGYYLGSLLGNFGPWIAGLGFALGVAGVIVYDRKVVRRQNIGYTITAFAGDIPAGALRKEEDNHG